MIALHREWSIVLTTVTLIVIAVSAGDVESCGAAFCNRAFVTLASQEEEPRWLTGTGQISEKERREKGDARVCVCVCLCVCSCVHVCRGKVAITL